MKSSHKPLLTLLIVLFVAWMSRPYFVVPAGMRGVVFNRMTGLMPVNYDEGIHFRIPFVYDVYLYDVRQRTYSMSRTHWEGDVKGDDSLPALTADGQQVSVDISVRFHPDRRYVWKLHQQIGPDYIAKIIRPEIRSHVRIAIAEHPVNKVYSEERERVERDIQRRLAESLRANFILVDDVLLRDVRFSQAFAKAVEEKQIAQQDAQRMQYVLDKTNKEKEQKIIEAQGEAEAIDLKGKALATNAKVIQYEYVRKVAPHINTIITDSEQLPTATPR